MQGRGERLCIMIGPIGFLLFGIGIWPLAHFLPPPSPSATAEQIAALYQNNTTGIRLGAALVMLGASLFAPFFAVLSVMLHRIEGPRAPYAWTQAIGATVVIVCFFVGPMFLTVTAFRPERAPELTQLLNDLSWIMIVTPGAPAVVQTLAVGFAILGDSRAQPLFPRWSGYLSLWVAVMFLPADVAIFFKHGPFAWDGIFPFWIPAILVGLWANIFCFLMLKASARTE